MAVSGLWRRAEKFDGALGVEGPKSGQIDLGVGGRRVGQAALAGGFGSLTD